MAGGEEGTERAEGVHCVLSPCGRPTEGGRAGGTTHMQRWHLTKAVNRQLIEVKQTNEHSALRGGEGPVESGRWTVGGRPTENKRPGQERGLLGQPLRNGYTHDGHVYLNVQRH